MSIWHLTINPLSPNIWHPLNKSVSDWISLPGLKCAPTRVVPLLPGTLTLKCYQPSWLWFRGSKM